MQRKPNRKPSAALPPLPPGFPTIVTLEFMPWEIGRLHPNTTKAGAQNFENWLRGCLLRNNGRVALDETQTRRAVAYAILKFGQGGPNKRLRSALYGPLARAGLDVAKLPEEWVRAARG